jgi:nicotinate phosphoribosyltransferase
VLLVDTYDVKAGVQKAIEIITRLGLGDTAGIRIDSGDLDLQAREARRLLDEAGLTRAQIFASGGLDEYAIADLVAAGAPIDAYGVGTHMGVSEDAPSLESVYKLVAYDGRPVMKLSAGKATTPGPKQVFRGPDGDVIGLRDEAPPAGAEPLLVPVMREGHRTHRESLDEARARFTADVDLLPAAAKQTSNPRELTAHLSPAAEELTTWVYAKLIGRDHAPEV